jgi:hypothetical protein
MMFLLLSGYLLTRICNIKTNDTFLNLNMVNTVIMDKIFGADDGLATANAFISTI